MVYCVHFQKFYEALDYNSTLSCSGFLCLRSSWDHFDARHPADVDALELVHGPDLDGGGRAAAPARDERGLADIHGLQEGAAGPGGRLGAPGTAGVAGDREAKVGWGLASILKKIKLIFQKNNI